MAKAALAVAALGFGWYLVTAADTAARPAASAASAADPGGRPGRSASDAFLSDVRDRQLPASLRRTSDADLVALGERFCDGLRRTGSSLEVVFQDQLAGRVYDGQTEVVTAARRHLCPHLPDRAR